MPLGARLISAGILLAASVSAQAPPSSTAPEAARPLTDQGLDNLRALAQLFGYVRYFYPSDEAAFADWSRLAVDAVRSVEPASSPNDLASRLQAVFAPVASEVRVTPAGAPRPLMSMQSGPYVLLYQHRGLGPPQGKAGTAFFSSRFLVPSNQSPLIAFAPFHVALPGAVSAMIPLAQYRGPGAVRQPGPLPAPPGSPNDRAVRLAAVIVAWNVFDHFYPYLDNLGDPRWLSALGRLLSAAARDADAQAFHATLDEMAVILRDGQGSVTGPGAPPDSVPPIVWAMAENRIVALSVEGTTEIKPGDALVSIDGKPAAEVLAAREQEVAGSTPQLLRERALAILLARNSSEKVSLEVEPFASPGTHRTVILACTARAADLHPPRPTPVAEIEPGIFYLDPARVADADFNAALPALSKAHGLVYDLRGPPLTDRQFEPLFGHFLNRSVQGPPSAAPIVSRPDGSETMYQDNQWLVAPSLPYLGGRRVFLSGGATIGHAETILSIVERYRMGDVVGETSGGASGAINSFTVPGGYEIRFTGERVRQNDGSQLFGAGIRPTIPVALTRAAIAAGHDEVLDRALATLR